MPDTAAPANETTAPPKAPAALLPQTVAECHTCVFRSIVTDRFGMVTAEFGNVTDHFGDVTGGVLKAA